jgi:hypothetical protein
METTVSDSTGYTEKFSLKRILLICGILSSLLFATMIIAKGFGAVAFGRRFRYYSIVTILILLIFGALAGPAAPRIEANLPTPWFGIEERIVILGFLIWVVVLAIILLQQGKKQDSH